MNNRTIVSLEVSEFRYIKNAIIKDTEAVLNANIDSAGILVTLACSGISAMTMFIYGNRSMRTICKFCYNFLGWSYDSTILLFKNVSTGLTWCW